MYVYVWCDFGTRFIILSHGTLIVRAQCARSHRLTGPQRLSIKKSDLNQTLARKITL